MNYTITATLGPASRQAPLWKEMFSSGTTSFRLNTSHISIEELSEWTESLSSFLEAQTLQIPLVLDLQGSKWRLGKIPSQTLSKDSVVRLVFGSEAGGPDILPVPHLDFFKAARYTGAELVLNDAKAVLTVLSFSENEIEAVVKKEGLVSSAKGITVRGTDFRIESLSEKDAAIIELTGKLPNIRYAVSYIKDAAEMLTYRRLMGPDAYIIAKIERESAVKDIMAISEYCNELWICRGDLGAEMGLTGMADSVFSILNIIGDLRRPVVMAGQVLEHMTHSSVPTRSEVCYIYESLKKGISGFVLSDETAVGQFPAESCRICSMFSPPVMK